MITGIVDEAIQQRVYVDFRPVWQSLEEIRPPDNLLANLRRLHDVQGDAPRPQIREGSTEQLGRLLFGHQGEGPPEKSVSGNWLVAARAPGNESKGTPGEIHVAPARGGLLEVVLVPRGASQQDSVPDLCWGLAEVIAGGRLPPEIIYESFQEEIIKWRHVEAGETRHYRLGRSLPDLRAGLFVLSNRTRHHR
jgi:hypothetical protein